MSEKLREIAAGKASELQDMRDVSLRSVVKSYLEGDPHLFDIASSFFEEGAPIMDGLLKVKYGTDSDPVKSIGHLVGSVSSMHFRMEREGLIETQNGQ